MILHWIALAIGARLTISGVAAVLGVGGLRRPSMGQWDARVGALAQRWPLPWDLEAVVRHRRVASMPGTKQSGTADSWRGRAIMARLAATILGIAIAALLLDRGGPCAWLAPVSALAGLLGCDAVEAVSWRRRRRAGADAVPLCLQLWSALTDATATPRLALRSAATVMPEQLRAICERALARQGLGESLMVALADEARIAELTGLAAVADRLGRGAGLGLPIGPQLQALAAEMLDRERRRRLRRAGRAVPLATLVSAMVIAPACVVVLGLLVIGAGLPTLRV